TWGLNFQRQIARREEEAYWSPTPEEAGGVVSRFGELAGLVLPRAPRRLEVAPYVASGLTRTPASLVDGGEANPFYRGADPTVRVGADVRLGLPAGLTLTATVNPDFGQVEVDPAVVNLSAFESFFEEQRPFFVEGTDVFNFGQTRAYNRYSVPTFFYSRRIGRTPQRDLDDATYVDAPLQTTIATAAKVSGQVGGWSIGLLDAVTLEETARFAAEDGTLGEAPVEPMANYFVGRLRRDLRGGLTNVGLLATGTHRDLGDDAFLPLLRRSAYLGGLDFQHQWGDRTWLLSGYVVGTHIAGDSAAILAAQRSSARYFQRPDADHLTLDPSRTSLTGHAAALALVRTGGQHWLWSLEAQEISPGFEVNDLGFFGRADARALSTNVIYRETRPGPLFLNYRAQAFSNHAWDFGGDPIYHFVGVRGDVQFRNYASATLYARAFPTFYNPTLTRGGPIATVPAQAVISAGFTADRRRPFVWGVSGALRTDRSGEYDRSFTLTSSWRPSPAVLLSVVPFAGQQFDTDQYVSAVDDAAATATFGTRYVLSDIDGTWAGVELRLDWTFSPTMTLQLFAQPYVEGGRFTGFKEFLTPRTYDFAVYGEDRGTIGLADGVYTVDPDGDGPSAAFTFDDPDYTFRSLRGSAVFRWEYRPGSALFVVWQRVGEDFAPFGDLSLGRDFGDALRQPAQDVFLAKLTYWIGR
ncbi:MAG TPA: DUF5916 domain-containing protein, partial [Rhodothermales bacterium]|nr:DUF5916 domain-containing protein [Rhodothermales bacterium]